MSYFVSGENTDRVVLNESDPIKSVLQNVRMILQTRQGTIPLYRNFGLPMKFLDKPAAIAKPLLIAEIREAISEFEPRAEILNVSFKEDEPGRLIPVVEIEVKV